MSDERAREASGVARKLLHDLRNAKRSEEAFALEDVIEAEFARRAELEAEVVELRDALATIWAALDVDAKLALHRDFDAAALQARRAFYATQEANADE